MAAEISLTAALLAMSGCFGVPILYTNVDKTVPEKTATVVIHETDRAAMRQLFGEPLAASSYWGFDLYRLSGTDAGVIFLVQVPIPIPIWATWDKVSAWVIAEYGADGKVAAIATGLTHSNTDEFWEHSGPASLRLEAGDVVLKVDGAGKPPLVLVAPAKRDIYLNGFVSSADCMLLAGCEFDGCRTVPAAEPSRLSLAIDAGQSTSSPSLAMPDEGLYLLAAVLSKGEHLLQLRESTSKHDSQVRVSVRATCSPGTVSFIHALDASGAGAMDTLTELHEIPDFFRDQPLLVWRGGEWVVPQEPTR